MRLAIRNDMAKATLHMLHTCPFCWKVRGLIEYLNLDVDYVSVNGLKIKKAVSFAGTGEKFQYILTKQENSTLTQHRL